MKVSRSALLPFSAMQMYDVVADIDAYPEFLNWCEGTEIVRSTDAELVACLKVAYKKLRFQFTTSNLNMPGESIELKLVDGPFSNLHGIWAFKPLGEGASKVSIDMDFNLDTKLVPGVVGKVFEKIISSQLDAFQKRAQQLYGTSNA